MGCFPLILLFALGTGLGYAMSGRNGALCGAGIGLLLGILLSVALLRMMRDHR